MRFYLFLLAFSVVTMLAGCAESSALIARNNQSDRLDVFQVQEVASPAPAGYVDLAISAIVKTHVAGAYTTTDPHGTDKFEMSVNVDGQAMRLPGHRSDEKKSDLTMADPEGGTGTTYLFQSVIRLKEGSHRVFIAIPVEGVAVVKEFTLKAGQKNRLFIEPVYGTQTRKLGISNPLKETFKAGVKGLRLILNGVEL